MQADARADTRADTLPVAIIGYGMEGLDRSGGTGDRSRGFGAGRDLRTEIVAGLRFAAPRDPPRARGEPRRAGCWDGIPGPIRNGNRAFSRDADRDLFEISEYRP
jgi:hypothetical protein